MKIGCCMGRERIALVREAGFDYVEITVTDNLVPLEGDAAWRPIRHELEAAGLPVEAANVFFPGTWRLTGPSVDLAATRGYVETAVRRAAEVGVAVMVLGSGRARAVPEGFPHAQALEQLAGVLAIMGEVGARHGVTIALEPLRRAESNVIHTVAEAARLVRPLQLPRVGVLADLYHIDEEQEPFDDLLGAGDLLQHVHVADSLRRAPGMGTYDYPGFFGRLKQAGYRGRVSAECLWGDLEREGPAAVAYMRRRAAEAGL